MVGKKYFYENMQVMAKALDNDPETKDRLLGGIRKEERLKPRPD